MARPVLQGRKNVTFNGTTTNPASISLTSGWTVGAGGATYTPVEDDVVYVGYSIGSSSDADRDVTIVTSGYTELADLFSNGSSQESNLGVFRKVMGATPDTALQVGPTGNNAFAGAVQVEVWSGVDTTTPEDVTTTTATGSGTDRPNPPSITPTTADAVVTVFGSGASGTGAAFTQSGSELTNFLSTNSADSTDATIGGGHFEWTSGAFDPVVWTGGANLGTNAWCAACVALRPAPLAYSMPADAGSYTLTGTATGLLRGLVLQAEQPTPAGYGPELLTNGDFGGGATTGWTPGGATLSVVSGRLRVTNTAASIGFADQTVSSEIGRKYRATADRYDGTAPARLWIGKEGSPYYTIDDGTGATDVTFTAEVTTVTFRAHALEATLGDYAEYDNFSLKEGFGYFVSGTDATLSTGVSSQTMSADPGSYALTGTAASLLFNRLVEAVPGSYALTGTATNLYRNRLITAVAGVYTYTGTAANLRESGIVMSADPATYSLTGTAANFLKGRTAAADPGIYALTGTAVTFLRSVAMPAAAGSYSLTGTAANLARGRSLAADPGTYALTGTAAGLLHSKVIAAEAGIYTYVGTDPGLSRTINYSMPVDAGVYMLTGVAVGMSVGVFDFWVVEPDPVTVVWQVEADPATAVGANYVGFNSLFYDPSFYDTTMQTWATEDRPQTVAIFEET